MAILFYKMCLWDHNILEVLHAKGYVIIKTGLMRLLQELGLMHRGFSYNKKETDRLLLDVVQQKLNKGAIAGYGQGHLYTYFQTQQYFVSQ